MAASTDCIIAIATDNKPNHNSQHDQHNSGNLWKMPFADGQWEHVESGRKD